MQHSRRKGQAAAPTKGQAVPVAGEGVRRFRFPVFGNLGGRISRQYKGCSDGHGQVVGLLRTISRVLK